MSNVTLFPPGTMIDSFRESGYRDTSMALAELIDNSIQAEANSIRIIAFEQVSVGARRNRYVSKIAVYDDGCGMEHDVLQSCLAFAQGTRLQDRSGIGRFGVGLPLASISQCIRTSVYSWKDGNEPYMTYLDVDEIKESNKSEANDIVKKSIPSEIISALDLPISSSGTLVVWDLCDKLDFKKSSTLIARMEASFCRIYRHFLDDDDDYGRRRDIRIITVGPNGSADLKLLRPNDPLYLMTPNTLPGWEDKATNEEFSFEKFTAYTRDNKPSTVEIRFSVIKSEIARWSRKGEGVAVVDHYKNNVGISFVRAGREIDFGDFKYFNPQELKERYWGCEVRFEPDLDELFGVTNNKQAVRGIDYAAPEEVEHLKELAIDDDDFDHKLNLRAQLSEIIKSTLKKAKSRIDDLAPKSTEEGIPPEDPSNPVNVTTVLVNDELKKRRVKTKTKIESENQTEIEKEDQLKRLIEIEHPGLADHEVEKLVKKLKDLEIAITFKNWPGGQFYTIERAGSTNLVAFNTGHPFMEDVYNKITRGTDSAESLALHLLFLAAGRAEDELYDDQEQMALEKFRDRWGAWLKVFLMQLRQH